MLYRERSTIEPSTYDQPNSGYMAVIAAVVLTGSLCMLGCMIGAIVFCVKRKRDQKRHLKSLVSQNKTIMPIVKETVSMSQRKPAEGGTELTFDHQQQILYTEQPMGMNGPNSSLSNVDSTLSKSKDTSSYRNPNAKYMSTTEPDLINEVQGVNDSYTLYQSTDRPPSVQLTTYQLQPELRATNVSRVSFLDQDGYPANYGLPKMPFNNACTLPRLRYRIPDGAASTAMSVPSPTARYASREAEMMVRSNAYDAILPRTDPRFTADGYPYPAYRTLNKHQLHQMSAAVASGSTHHHQASGGSLGVAGAAVGVAGGAHRRQEQMAFPPRPLSPPAGYRGEPAATPLSPRSLLNKSGHEAAPTRAEDNFPQHHPESPDEGYVGDSMDV